MPNNKAASKGKKKLKSHPVFDEEYLKDSDEPGYHGRDNTESSTTQPISDDVDSSSAETQEDEYAEDDGQGSEDEPEQDKMSYQDFLLQILRAGVDKGKRKRGHIEKRTGKRSNLKVCHVMLDGNGKSLLDV